MIRRARRDARRGLGRFGGANQDLLWQGFAMRGFGQFQNTDGDAGHEPGARLLVADGRQRDVQLLRGHEGRTRSSRSTRRSTSATTRPASTQIADTDPATDPSGTPATSNLDNTAQFVADPGRLVALGKRWGVQLHRRRARLRGRPVQRAYLQPGEIRNITIHFAPNFASSAQGATITGDALGTNTNLANLIDDNEATNNGQTGAPVVGRWFVIALGDVGPNGSNVKRLGVSALLHAARRPTTGSRRSARSTPTRVARGRTRRTRPATDRSTRAGRRSSRRRPMRSRRSTRGPWLLT